MAQRSISQVLDDQPDAGAPGSLCILQAQPPAAPAHVFSGAGEARQDAAERTSRLKPQTEHKPPARQLSRVSVPQEVTLGGATYSEGELADLAVWVPCCTSMLTMR